MSEMSEVVQRQIEDGVALLTLNRPDRLNAWTSGDGALLLRDARAAARTTRRSA